VPRSETERLRGTQPARWGAVAVRLAKAGASSQEIMAITGHTTLAEVERYTRDLAQKRLAESAMARLERGPGKG
jgi:hypothetical protein